MNGQLTATSLSSLRRCPRQHYYRFEIGLSRVRTATPLRFRAAFHKGLELFHGLFGQDTQTILGAVLADYEAVPNWADPTDRAVERETLQALLLGYFWRYGTDNVEHVAVEQAFELPLVNPQTGAASRTFCLAGKINEIVRLQHVHIGRRMFTTEPWLEEFIDRLTGPASPFQAGVVAEGW